VEGLEEGYATAAVGEAVADAACGQVPNSVAA
jgi:hypothetical protein